MIEKIREEALKIDWKNIDDFIKFYESNQLFFENYNLLKNQDDIVDVIQIKMHYISALNGKERYTKGLKNIAQLDELIEKLDPNSDLLQKAKVDRLFYYGMLKGNLKEYKTAFSIFSKLIKIDPENDLYKEWYIAMKMNLQYEYLKYVSFLGLAIVLGDIITGLAFDYNFDNRIVLFGWILIIGSWIGPKMYLFVKKYIK